MEVYSLLEAVKNGKCSVEEAAKQLKNLPYEDLGFAKLDHHRKLRSGFGEVVYCSGKTPEHTAEIFLHFAAAGSSVMGTRADPAHAQAVQAVLPATVYDPVSHLLCLKQQEQTPVGLVAVCTGGTSDIPMAEEAAGTAAFFGANVVRYYDVGVAGIHRLLSKIPEIRQANCVVAAAGMEGALAGVLSGLVEVPVVALPTSVGYGANFGGLSALLTMLNSCAEGIGVVNIDNGFGAGYLAAQINRLAVR